MKLSIIDGKGKIKIFFDRHITLLSCCHIHYFTSIANNSGLAIATLYSEMNVSPTASSFEILMCLAGTQKLSSPFHYVHRSVCL